MRRQTIERDPLDCRVVLSDDHSLLFPEGIKAVRQKNAFTRDVAEEVLALPEERLIALTGLYRPFTSSAKAAPNLLKNLPLKYLQQCANLQESFLQIGSPIPTQIAFLFDVGRMRPAARPFHIERRFLPMDKSRSEERLPMSTMRARQLIASFSEVSMALPSGGETEIVFTDKLSTDQIQSTLGNCDPLDSASLSGITTGSIDACEAISFWGDSYSHQDPHSDYLVHRSRPPGSKRFSFGIAASHPLQGFDI